MKSLALRLAVFVVASLVPWCVNAQAFRTYLASYGNDANPCTVAAPCRLLPAALNAVLDGGEVWILDSANFNIGTVNITKSVSIIAVPGQIASVVAVGGTPAISIATAGVKVALRNLVIPPNAASPGTYGVYVTAGDLLSVEDCLFANLASHALNLVNTGTIVHVKNSVFRNISGYGIWAQDGPTVNVVNSQFLSTAGLLVYALTASVTTTLNVTDSVIADGYEGVFVSANATGATARASVTRSTVHHVSYPLDAEVGTTGAATIYVGRSTIDASGHGWYIANPGASIVTYGNNQFSANGGSTGTLTFNSLQ